MRLSDGVNSDQTRGKGHGKGTLLTDTSVAVGALVLPCLLSGLNSILQLFMPGVAAAYLNQPPFEARLLLLLMVYVAGSLLFTLAGMAVSSLVLAQAVVICGVLLISVWKSVDAPKTVLVMSLAIIAMSVVVMEISSGWKIHDVYMKMVSSMTAEYDKAVALYKKNAQADLPVQLDDMILQVRQTLVAYFPGIVCSVFVFLSLMNTLVFMKINEIKGRAARLVPQFHLWRMPWLLVWWFILFGFMALVHSEPWGLIGKNGVLVASVFYLVQGFSVIQFFFKIMQTPVYIRYLVYALIGIEWYGLLLVVFTGLMDNWFDFRKRITDRMTPKDD